LRPSSARRRCITAKPRPTKAILLLLLVLLSIVLLLLWLRGWLLLLVLVLQRRIRLPDASRTLLLLLPRNCCTRMAYLRSWRA
jgi:hypothetical protein